MTRAVATASGGRDGVSGSISLGVESTLIIEGGTVVPMDADGTVIADGTVVIVGNRIDAVGSAGELPNLPRKAATIDASGKLVMPGLVNAHTHVYSALARGITAEIEPSANFVEILEHLWWRLDRALTETDVRLSGAAAALDLVRNGTTTIVDHHASQVHIDGSLSQVAESLSEVGLRANLCFEVTDRDGPEAREAGLAENERFHREISGRRESSAGAAAAGGSLLSSSVGLHASFTLEEETLERAAALAESLDIGCHIHVAEDEADVRDSLDRSGMRVVDRLSSLGVLGPRTVAAHCIHIDESETRTLRDTRTLVVHNPQSNMNNAVGRADVPRLLESGVEVGLGTDGFSASMFDEMKVANLIHRHASGDPRVGHGVASRLCLEGNPRIASTLLGTGVGRLEPGALADVIVLDYEPPTPLRTGNFGGHLIFGLTGWMVDTVIIDGRVVLKDRAFATVDDGEILAKAREQAADLWRRM